VRQRLLQKLWADAAAPIERKAGYRPDRKLLSKRKRDR
jgi:hypothetical protein